jgi:DNA repair exonuclease SbcCD ATPase subunit
MIEPIMFFGLGFLIATLLALVIVPLVHARAVRLTARRLEAATPVSMAEIQADKDQLRAEFAMSTRRLEISVDQLKAKTTTQLAELGKKTDAINRLKAELGEKTATIFSLEARDKVLREQLHTTEDELSIKTNALREAERTLADRQEELTRLSTEFDDTSVTAASQSVEIVALKTQIETLQETVATLEQEIKDTEGRLAQERGRVAAYGAQLAERERERDHLRLQVEAARQIEADLRGELSSLDRRHDAATEILRADKTLLESQLERAHEERGKLQREIAAIKREAEATWQAERVENALLRERINDVAAEVVRLTAALEGPDSPINSILADAGRARLQGNGQPAKATTVTRIEDATSSLADRIRALQAHASRLSSAT